MKSKFFLTFVLSIINFKIINAQHTNSTSQVNYIIDTIFFDQYWEQTQFKEDAKFARVAKRAENRKPLGTVRDYYYPSWKKQWEGKLQSENPNMPIGLCTSWYPNGKVESFATYKNGKPQSDLKMYKESGTPYKCTYKFVEALPLTKVKLHSFYHEGSSRTVQSIIVPKNSLGLLYRIDIRDEGKPPISWGTALALASGNPSSMLMAGMQMMKAEAAKAKEPTGETKCWYFITTSKEDADYFIRTKGNIPSSSSCFYTAKNTTKDTRQFEITSGTETIYFCVNNDNDITAAIVTLNVSFLQRQCK